jgi:hypothetical protein
MNIADAIFQCKVTSQQFESGGIYLYKPVPDCTQCTGRVGCIVNPKSSLVGDGPWWAGTLSPKTDNINQYKMHPRNANVKKSLAIHETSM